MEEVYKQMGTVIGFSIVVLLVQNFIGEKAGQYTVLFTLFSMLLLNSNKLVTFTQSFKKKEE